MFSRKILLVLTLSLAVLVSSTSRAEFFNSKQKFYTIKTEHFYIHYPDGIGPLAEEMRTISEESYDLITSRLEWQVKSKIHVVLSDKTDAANGMATVMPYNFILLYMAPPAADSTLDHHKEYLKLLFSHELTHIVHIDQNYRLAPLRLALGQIVSPNGLTPGWMREGMAVFEESLLADGWGRNNSVYADMVLRTAVYENNFPRIDQIAGLSKHFPGGSGPYLFGGKFFEWLAGRYGEDRIYKYQKEYASSLWLFSLNNKARRVFGKSFYKLYKEFKEDVTNKAMSMQQAISRHGTSNLEDVVKTPKDSQMHYTPHPNGQGYAYYQYGFDDSARIIIVKDAESKPVEIKRKLFGQMSFSRDGRYLAFSTLSAIERKTSRAEVYYYDLEENKLYHAINSEEKNKSLRVKDPDYSPTDGGNRWVVTVRNFQNTDQLYVLDLFEKTGYVLTNAAPKTQFSSPRYSNDGSKIVVSRKNGVTGQRDIVVYSNTGQFLYNVTNDIHNDYSPVYSRYNGKLYFNSFRTGVPNIFSYDAEKKTVSQVSNVIDGVFQPMPNPKTPEIFVQRYSSNIKYIQKFRPRFFARTPRYSKKIAQLTFGDYKASGRNFSITDDLKVVSHIQSADTHPVKQESILPFALNPVDNMLPSSFFSQEDYEPEVGASEKTEVDEETADEKKTYPSAYKNLLGPKPHTLQLDTTNPEDAKKYSAFPHLLRPRYISPYVSYFESTVLAALSAGRTDPLYRHTWSAFANYRTDAAYIGAGASYVYSRYKPLFYVGAIRYAVDWGTINGTQFFEDRNQGYAGTSFAIGKHVFNTAYFYEHRQALTNLNVNLTNMRPYAGLRLKYSLSNYKKFTDSISPENGFQIRISGEWTDQLLASDAVNEERNIRGDFRYYIEMPWSDHHVLGLRVAAGWTWGDQQQFGVYRLGGPFGEGTFASYSSKVFPLRGLSGITYAGDHAFMFSAEYRWPLILDVNRGVGTLPVFMDKLFLNLFVDGGDIRFRTSTSDLFSRMLVSAGAELNGRIVVGYGLALNTRLGYGLVLTNRDRLGTLTDSLTGQSLRNGSLYFQFGTSF